MKKLKQCECKNEYDGDHLYELKVKELRDICKLHNITMKLSNKEELVKKIIFFNKWKNYNFCCENCKDEYGRDLYQIEIKERIRKEEKKDLDNFNKRLLAIPLEVLLELCD